MPLSFHARRKLARILCAGDRPLASCAGGRDLEHGGEPMKLFPTKIVLATDGSEDANQAARTAADLAQKTSSEDRKSTRLNSSHANISYAVFCLKKKTKIENISIYI